MNRQALEKQLTFAQRKGDKEKVNRIIRLLDTVAVEADQEPQETSSPFRIGRKNAEVKRSRPNLRPPEVQRASGVVEAPEPLERSVIVKSKDINQPPIFWIVQDLVRTGLVNLSGLSGVGKTTFIVDLARSMMTGDPLLGRKVNQVSYAIWAAEDFTGTNELCHLVMGEDLAPESRFIRPGAPLFEDDGGKFMIDLITEHEVKLLIVDSLSFYFSESKERGDVNRFLGKLHQVANDNQACILFVDHSPRVDPTRMNGSTDRQKTFDFLLNILDKDGSRKKFRLEGKKRGSHVMIDLEYEDNRFFQDSHSELFEELPDVQKAVAKVVYRTGGAKVAEIVKAIGKSRGSVYKALTALEADGKNLIHKSGATFVPAK